MESMINLEYSISDCDFLDSITTCYAVLNLKTLVKLNLEDDSVISTTQLYEGTEVFRQFLGTFRGIDDSVNYFLRKEK